MYTYVLLSAGYEARTNRLEGGWRLKEKKLNKNLY